LARRKVKTNKAGVGITFGAVVVKEGALALYENGKNIGMAASGLTR